MDKAPKINEALAIDPDNAVGWTSRGVYLGELGKLDEAIASFKRAIQLDPELASAHSNLGNALREQGEIGEAEKAFAKARALAPKDP